MNRQDPVNPEIYDKDYFLKYCDGANEFASLQAEKLPERLQRCVEIAHFKRDQKILDIGCGRGEIAYYAAKKGCIITAVDYSKEAVRISKKLLSKLPNKIRQRVDVIRIDAKKLDFPNETFDQIIMTDVIEHLQPWEVDIIIEKCFHFLKTNGRLVINTSPNVWFVKFSYPVVRILRTIFKLKDPGGFIEFHPEIHIFEQSPITLWRTLKKFETEIWGENLHRAFWLNRIPLINLFTATLFAIAVKKPKGKQVSRFL